MILSPIYASVLVLHIRIRNVNVKPTKCSVSWLVSLFNGKHRSNRNKTHTIYKIINFLNFRLKKFYENENRERIARKTQFIYTIKFQNVLFSIVCNKKIRCINENANAAWTKASMRVKRKFELVYRCSMYTKMYSKWMSQRTKKCHGYFIPLIQ